MKIQTRNLFSIVELFVVFAILGILVSMLFPSMQRFHSIGEQNHCRSNMLRLARVTSVYIEDYDGYYPYGLGTYDFNGNQIPTDSLGPQELLYDYTSGKKDVFICPTDPSPDDYWWWRYRGHPNEVTSSSYMFCEFGLYGTVNVGDNRLPLRQELIRTPRTYPYMTDGRCCPNGWRWTNMDPNLSNPRLDWNHNEYANVLYGDAHIGDVWLYDDLNEMRRRPDRL